jgi:hypothetical protein
VDFCLLTHLPLTPMPEPDIQVWTIWCLIDGDSKPFSVHVPVRNNTYDLKVIIQKTRQNGALAKVDAADLELWKASTSKF